VVKRAERPGATTDDGDTTNNKHHEEEEEEEEDGVFQERNVWRTQ